MASSRRADGLRAAFEDLLDNELLGRIADVDRPAADAAGTLAAKRSLRGRSIEVRDALIAGVALARGARIATRNVRHFEGCGAPVIDPWNLAPA